MAQRRMFSLKIIDTDLFLEMPHSTRLLYYELSMRADDDGFISSPKKILKMVGCSDDDFKILLSKKYLIPFESGVCVVRHWKIHNYIQKDRYSQTVYLQEKNQLHEDENGMYTKCIQNDNIMDTQVRLELGQVSIELEKEIVEKEKVKTFKVPSILEIQEFLKEKAITNVNAEKFYYYYESNGWMVGKAKMKSWHSAIMTWKNKEFNNPQIDNVKKFDMRGFV